MSFIRTVLGDIAPEALGVCYAHEHVIIDPCHMTEKHPDFLLDSVEIATAELTQFRRDGGRAMIDSMPTGGRNAAKLAEVSRRTGVHLVAPTGLHLRKYYPADHWAFQFSGDELAEFFAAEIEHGIQPDDPNQPRLAQRAGLIKIAGSLDRLQEHEHRIFQAAAEAHRRTGCPILTHTEQGTAALEQVAVLKNFGADLSRVTLSHTDRRPDTTYHRDILQSGVNVEFDGAVRGNPTLELLFALYPEFPTQLMLGMDAARRGYWKGYGGGPGLSDLLTDFSTRLPPGMRTQIFILNPARAFAFAPAQPKHL